MLNSIFNTAILCCANIVCQCYAYNEVKSRLNKLNVSYKTGTEKYYCLTLISTNASNNPSYGKTAFISFAVPAGATYQITSYPAQNYSCGSGVFSVFGYQT